MWLPSNPGVKSWQGKLQLHSRSEEEKIDLNVKGEETSLQNYSNVKRCRKYLKQVVTQYVYLQRKKFDSFYYHVPILVNKGELRMYSVPSFLQIIINR